MKKWIIYTTGGILGSAAVAGVAVSTVYYTKYKNLYDGLKTHGLSVEVYSYDSPTSTTASGHTIYKVTDNEKTLEDLLLDYPEDFKLSYSSQYGRMVLGVFGVSAVYATDKAWWQLASPTYVLDHPETKSNPSNNPQTSIKDALNVGVASVVLDHSQIIKFYKTPAK